jgi:hypothetical protein
MAQTVITAHVVVPFAGDEDVNVVVELDDRETGFNAGKTSFAPGQDAYILVFLPTGWIIDSATVTAGTIGYVQNDVKVADGFLEFPNTDDASLSYPFGDTFQYTWLGAAPGIISLPTQFRAVLPPRTRDPLSGAFVPEYRIGIASYSYNSNCQVWKVSGVPTSISRVMAFFVAKKP